MATNILALPNLGFDMEVNNNEDWLDSWAYLDANGNAIPLVNLSFAFAVRPTAGSSDLRLFAASAPYAGVYALNGLVDVGGSAGNVLCLVVSRTVMEVRGVPGAYRFEMQASGDGITRVIAAGNLTIIQGLVP